MVNSTYIEHYKNSQYTAEVHFKISQELFKNANICVLLPMILILLVWGGSLTCLNTFSGNSTIHPGQRTISLGVTISQVKT